MGNKVSAIIRGKVHGNTMKHITKDRFNDIEIPLPDIRIQREIIKKISEEQIFIEANKKLIAIYVEKIKEN